MSDFDDQIARLRVAVDTQRLAPDLGRWLLDALEAARSKRRKPIKRTQRRNDLLRRAAALMTGSLSARAERLRLEILATDLRDDTEPVRALVLQALAADRWGTMPTSHRQLSRILEGHDD